MATQRLGVRRLHGVVESTPSEDSPERKAQCNSCTLPPSEAARPPRDERRGVCLEIGFLLVLILGGLVLVETIRTNIPWQEDQSLKFSEDLEESQAVAILKQLVVRITAADEDLWLQKLDLLEERLGVIREVTYFLFIGIERLKRSGQAQNEDFVFLVSEQLESPLHLT